MSEYNSKNTKIQACKLKDGDTIISAELVYGDRDVILITKNGMGIRFNGTEVNPTGRATIGVKAISLKEGDYVVKGYEIQEDNGYMLLIGDRGYTSRVPIEEYVKQGRGGIGFKTFRFTKMALG